MILVCCLDKKDGLRFNHRRQSRDSAVIADLLKQAGGRPILIDRYSALLFSEGAQVSDAPERAGAGEFYFYEGESALPDSRQIESVILYLWNREYPADIRFDRGLLAGMKRVGKSDFAGTSHEKITKEVYER